MKFKLMFLLFIYIIFLVGCGNSGSYIGNWFDPDDKSFKVSLKTYGTIHVSYYKKEFSGSFSAITLEDEISNKLLAEGIEPTEELKNQAQAEYGENISIKEVFLINTDLYKDYKNVISYIKKHDIIQYGERTLKRK